MISYEKLLALAHDYEEDLTEFRLTGKIAILTDFLEAVIGADQLILVEDFYKAMTENEKNAFLAIRKEIGLSGNISITKMIQKTNLSRPVWNSLLIKMEKFGIAQIKNQGAKGTHIEISKEIDDGGLST